MFLGAELDALLVGLLAIAENERLRAALKEIADFTPEPNKGDAYQQIAVFAKHRAYAALANEQIAGK